MVFAIEEDRGPVAKALVRQAGLVRALATLQWASRASAIRVRATPQSSCWLSRIVTAILVRRAFFEALLHPLSFSAVASGKERGRSPSQVNAGDQPDAGRESGRDLGRIPHCESMSSMPEGGMVSSGLAGKPGHLRDMPVGP